MKRPACVAVAALLVGAAAAGARVPKAVVPGVRAEVAPPIERHAAEARKKVMVKLALGARVAANCKVPVRVKAFTDPWGGLAQLEAHGLKVAEATRGGVAALPAVLDALSASVGKPAGEAVEAPKRPPSNVEEHVEHLVWVLDRAKALRDEAKVKLPKDADRFMVMWPTRMLGHWGPQVPLNEQTRQALQNDRAFHAFAFTVLRWDKLVGSAKLLASLAREAHVASLAKALAGARPLGEPVEGVTGDLLVKKDTPHGLILVGGKGPNTYELKVPVALIIDLGGDDTYKGMVASTSDWAHPNSLVIDVAGDDVYGGQALGLATGRLGVGMLVDLAGNDRYQLGAGACGGAGFGGIGVLCDAAGDDVYTGSRFTQGVAFGGIGLLLDLGGTDRHTSHIYAIGYAGAGGAAAVVDLDGDDSYQCGRKVPSGYNRSDGPKLKLGHPRFQWTAFGMGTGQGRRIYPPSRQAGPFQLAGGVGMLIDAAGNDRYDSSNFSQACGYFFGVGLKLDLAGDDVHGAARYGHASGAHFGMGLFVDYGGADTYQSTGPTYNGGCSWDHSAFLCVDAGDRDDVYDWARSGGPARADIGSWGAFADLGGNDRYVTSSGLGRTTRGGFAVFLDKAGTDDYTGVRSKGKTPPADGETHANDAGGLFVDKE